MGKLLGKHIVHPIVRLVNVVSDDFIYFPQRSRLRGGFMPDLFNAECLFDFIDEPPFPLKIVGLYFRAVNVKRFYIMPIRQNIRIRLDDFIVRISRPPQDL